MSLIESGELKPSSPSVMLLFRFRLLFPVASGDDDGWDSCSAGCMVNSLIRDSRACGNGFVFVSAFWICASLPACTKLRGVGGKKSFERSFPPSKVGGVKRGRALKNSGSSGAGNDPKTADVSSITPSVSKPSNGSIAMLWFLNLPIQRIALGTSGLGQTCIR